MAGERVVAVGHTPSQRQRQKVTRRRRILAEWFVSPRVLPLVPSFHVLVHVTFGSLKPEPSREDLLNEPAVRSLFKLLQLLIKLLYKCFWAQPRRAKENEQQ